MGKHPGKQENIGLLFIEKFTLNWAFNYAKCF